MWCISFNFLLKEKATFVDTAKSAHISPYRILVIRTYSQYSHLTSYTRPVVTQWRRELRNLKLPPFE